MPITNSIHLTHTEAQDLLWVLAEASSQLDHRDHSLVGHAWLRGELDHQQNILRDKMREVLRVHR